MLMMSAVRSGNHTFGHKRHDVGVQVEELTTRRAADAHDVCNHNDLADPFGHKRGC